MVQFTKRQWLTLIVIGIADFCNAICVSLQAPFYPQEAERKGATATEYGLVFGIFELIVFLVSPFYGQHLNRIGPKLLFNGGIYTTGVCSILFGFLDKVQGHYPFIILSFIIRIVEAMGNAAFLTASFALIAKEFPDNVATTFASLETFFGLGLIVGPTVGGALYEVGGYTMPFAVMGSALFLAAIFTGFILPHHEEGRDMESGSSMYTVLKIPGVMLSAASIIVTSMSIGFLQATLEPHLRQFLLPPVILGLMFVINGGTYAISAPIWGRFCDKTCPPKVITILGTILVACGFSLVGPAPFIPTNTMLPLTIVGLVLHGLGIGAQLVASFTDALRTSIAHGFPNNLETFGLISGLWTSTFALGAFIGPSVSGILYDNIGFRNASMFVVGTHLIVGFSVFACLLCSKKTAEYVEIKDEKISNCDFNGSIGRSASISVTESAKSIRSVGNGISIERSRPPGMNSLIACNSYKSKAWPRKQANMNLGPYSYSYGTIDRRNGGGPYLQGVA
ncbi:PREDICTED: MFS-type transporter SLC18B1-like [Nicrophorus vespilloides]|uniref:MFS-type transporter SLC18B1-like n=1 Tax=Nicrophorus vespilloides TaxID=110193 RepID=A0ABM1N2B5_NICVS|nr:PREDICTED: MFS-type transporter SLC18B1-like [Nicrophorus vespilloides]